MEYVQSNSTDLGQVSADLLHYLNEIFEKKSQRTSDKFSVILIYCDATNGEVYIYWYDSLSQTTDDNSGYAIEFPKLFDESNDSDEGSFYFDRMISEAVRNLAMLEEGKNILNHETVVFQDEMNEPKKIS